MEFLHTTKFEILNQGNDPTFCSGNRLEVIDITLGSFRLQGSIKSWQVSPEPSLSDHRHILFILQSSLPVRQIRNPKGTKWNSFRENLRDRL